VEINVQNITKVTNKSISSRAKGTVPVAILADGSLQLERPLHYVPYTYPESVKKEAPFSCSQNNVLVTVTSHLNGHFSNMSQRQTNFIAVSCCTPAFLNVCQSLYPLLEVSRSVIITHHV